MRGRILVGTLVILIVAALGIWRWQRVSAPMLDTVSSTERVRPPGCNPLPAVPPLPASLTPAAPTVDSVLQALDASLGPAHKAYLRCFPEEDELVARTHFGMGRWLRNTLHLTQRNPLTVSLRAAGAANPDDMSARIVRGYSRSLRGLPIAAGVAK